MLCWVCALDSYQQCGSFRMMDLPFIIVLKSSLLKKFFYLGDFILPLMKLMKIMKTSLLLSHSTIF